MQPEKTYQLYNKYLPFALLYMFFNAVGLPEGLFYTLFLTPFFIYYSFDHGFAKPFVWFIILSFLFITIHFYNGITSSFYLKSLLMAFCHFSFCIAFWVFLKNVSNLKRIYNLLTYTNLLLICIALLSLLIPSFTKTFWYIMAFTPGVNSFPRLKLFWSEASVYSLYITPLVFFYLLSLIKQNRKYTLFFFMILLVSLALSFSLGVLISILLALLFIAIFHYSFFFSNRTFNIGFAILLILVVTLLIVAYKLHPELALFKRVQNIFLGKDTSAKGRTYEAFILAYKIIQTKSIAFGIGWGQLKLIGRPIVLSYYQYATIPAVVRIPNACSETLISFGVVGFALRLFFELFLFVKTKVFSNYYRLGLFVFIFIYQFTGSYITNIAEYVIWMLAFSASFKEFDKPQLKAA